MVTSLLVALVAAAGGAMRFLVDARIRARLARAGATTPAGILVVNVFGSMLLGTAAGVVAARGSEAHTAFSYIAAFSGAFTTFSTAAVDCAKLIRAGRAGAAAAYWLGMAVLAIGAAWGCFSLARAVVG